MHRPRVSWDAVAALVTVVVPQAWAALAYADFGEAWPSTRTGWDTEHYVELARHGYPDATDERPMVYPDRYAFYPVFPILLRALAALGAPLPDAAPVANMVAGGLALWMVFRLANEHIGRPAGLAAVAGVALMPAAPVFQMGYTEGLALLLLALILHAGLTKRWGLLLLLVGLLALTRPMGGPVGLAATCAWALQAQGHGRRLRRLAIGSALSVVAALLWPALAAMLSGRIDIYLAAGAAFRRPGAPSNMLGFVALLGPAGWLCLSAIVGFLVIVAARLLPAATPTSVRVWLVAQPVFLLSAAVVGASIVRYLITIAPVLGLLLTPVLRGRGRWPTLVAVVLVGAWGGAWWVSHFTIPGPHVLLP